MNRNGNSGGGLTSRPGGRRARKSDPLIEAGGAVDELNAHVGLCLRQARDDGAERIVEALEPIASELMAAGALIAAVGADRPEVRLDDAAVARIERQIDAIGAELPKLKDFILPGGSGLACRLHVARTVCRRAERSVVAAAEAEADVPVAVLRYLDRLGDLLFAAARLANRIAGVEEERWEH